MTHSCQEHKGVNESETSIHSIGKILEPPKQAKGTFRAHDTGTTEAGSRNAFVFISNRRIYNTRT